MDAFAILKKENTVLRGAVLYAKDLRKLVEFYSALGGDIVDGQEGDFTTMKTLDTELIILQAPEHISSKIEITNPPTVRASTPIKPIVLVPSIELILETLSRSGGAILPDAKRWEFKGHLVVDIVDPEGNVVQLWQPMSS